MRLVDIDEVVINFGFEWDDIAPTAGEFVSFLKRQKTIDAVTVVRCRDCKRWDDDPDSYGKDDGPKGRCRMSFEETLYDDFCSYGERKESHDGV